MARSRGPTEAQMTIHLIQQGLLAGCALITLISAARAARKVTDVSADAKDFIRGAKQAL